jgi:hypothetical protein
LEIAMPFDYLTVGPKGQGRWYGEMENQQMRITEAFFSWENIR